MSNEESAYRRVARRYGVILAQIDDSQWQNPTPCLQWNVRDLTTHVIETHRRVYAMVDANAMPALDEDVAVDEQWNTVTSVMTAALDNPDVAGTLVNVRGSDQPFADLVEGLLMFDTLCHTWDLARAIGADEALDPTAVAIAHERLAALGDAIRVPGGFAAALPTPVDTDDQTRFLLFAGRQA